MFPSNLDQLSTIIILNYLEQENVLAKIFFKIGACPCAYKKKLEETIVKEILDDLLIFKIYNFYEYKPFLYIFQYLDL